ncbi:MAG: DNA adenine methylase [Promethearchaeota archaeon]
MKWAGGKRRVLAQFEKYIPREFNSYIEPFIGGGSMFFYLLPENATIMDINPDLINVYNTIKNDVELLIESLKKHKNEKEYYYSLRNIDKDAEKFSSWSDIEKASRIIYMNRCCFNGLYRVNSKGQFNVPFGSYKNPLFCDEENLFAVNKVLQGVTIINAGFEKTLEIAKKGDFIYFDPPYVPLSGTANFTSYSKENFNFNSQRKLKEVFSILDKRGCKLMLSNSHCEFILDLYKDFKIETIMAARAINSNGANRGKIKEVLVLNDYT